MGLHGGDVRFFFLLLWLPVAFRVFALPFLPSLSAGVYRVLGPGRGLLALAVPVAAAHLLMGEAGEWMWLFQWVAMGPIFVEAFSRSGVLERSMAGAVFITFILQACLLSMWSFQWGMAPWTLLEKVIEAAVRRSIDLYGAMGVDPQGIAKMQLAAPSLSRAMLAIMPGTVFAMDLLLFWWTLLVYRKVSAISSRRGPGPDTLRAWGMPYPWVWITIGGGILALLPGGALGGIGANLLIVMGTLHFLQGVGVVATFFQDRGVPPFLRGVFYVLIFFQQFVLMAVTVLGLFDIWFDFRRRWRAGART